MTVSMKEAMMNIGELVNMEEADNLEVYVHISSDALEQRFLTTADNLTLDNEGELEICDGTCIVVFDFQDNSTYDWTENEDAKSLFYTSDEKEEYKVYITFKKVI